jgi:hypothetical protein
MTHNTAAFTAAFEIGQSRLNEGLSDMEVVSSVLQRFGLSLSEFTGGLVGVACVTRDEHKALETDFVPGVPLSIVLVDRRADQRPMPIVGGLRVAESGFPVEVIVGGRTIIAHEEDGLEAGLSALACSRAFAFAEVMSVSSTRLHLQA